MKVRIFEVGPRDGLQNESQILSTETRLKFINLLAEAGHQDIEIGAFVNPEKIPQMAGSDEVQKQFSSDKTRNYWTLVPNQRGFESALASGASHIAIFTAASETFNLKNINATIEGSFARFREFLPAAKKAKMKVRGYISTCFGCPYEGPVDPKKVLKVTEQMLKLGVSEISIGDTIGVATPYQVRDLTKKLLRLVGSKKLALHFHDTRGTALANILMGLETGVTTFDASAGGLGGCPFALKATGNVATEDLLYMLHGMGVKTGIDLAKHCKASLFIQEALQKKLPSHYLSTIS